MKTVILSHRVKNYAAWKPVYDADADRRAKAGLKEIAVGASADDRQEVYMIYQTDDIDRSMIIMEDPDLAAAMEKAGVISEPKFIILEH